MVSERFAANCMVFKRFTRRECCCNSKFGLCTRAPTLEHGITIYLDRGTGTCTRTWSKRAEKLAEGLHQWKLFPLAGTRKLGWNRRYLYLSACASTGSWPFRYDTDEIGMHFNLFIYIMGAHNHCLKVPGPPALPSLWSYTVSIKSLDSWIVTHFNRFNPTVYCAVTSLIFPRRLTSTGGIGKYEGVLGWH